MTEEKKVPDGFKTYEDGKHRRYQLLFSVTGGAFALAKLFTEKESAALLGSLTLSRLCFGMAIFSLVMTADIFMFGQKMRRLYLPEVFGWQGKAVLIVIGLLLTLGWWLAAKTGATT